MVSELKSCCWCFSLRTGCRIIAVMRLVYSIIIIALCSLVLAQPDAIVSPLVRHESYSVEDLLAGRTVYDDGQYDSLYRIIVGSTVVAVCFCVLDIIMDCLLLFGVSARVPRLLKIWVWYISISMVIGIIIFCVSFNLLSRHNVKQSPSEYTRLITNAGVTIYYIRVVHSYHTKLASRNSARRVEDPLRDTAGGVLPPQHAGGIVTMNHQYSNPLYSA